MFFETWLITRNLNLELIESYVSWLGILKAAQPIDSIFKLLSILVTKDSSAKITVPEESLLLWLLVVLLAALAFISLDIATHAAFSFMAIPFSIAGSIWSYRRRYLAHHWLTHLVFAAALILVLFCLGGAFWGQIIERAKSFLGTDRDLVIPLALSFLLVALQTIRMWSLCYQRGLGSSIVISLMLMAGAMTIGNSPGFLVLLAIFVGLLVQALMLFYRSQIKLKPIGISIVPRPRQLTERHLPWPYLSKITALALVLGCSLALFAPHLRFPEITWNVPGLDQLIKMLPIEVDPTLTVTNPNNSPSIDGSPEAAGDRNNPGVVKSEPGSKSSTAGGVNIEVDEPSLDQQSDTADGSESTESIESTESTNPNNTEVVQTQQAIKNILATADRPLNTRAEQISYVIQYLEEHVSSTDCATNTLSLNCTKKFRLRSEYRPSFEGEKYVNGVSAQVQLSEQIPHREYYLAFQPSTPPTELLPQLTAPCPVNQPSCYKDRVFQVDEQEMQKTQRRLLRSLGDNFDINNPEIKRDKSLSPKPSPGSAGNQPLSSPQSPLPKPSQVKDLETPRSELGSKKSVDKDRKPNTLKNPRKKNQPDRPKPAPEKAKSNLIKPEQLMIFLRIAAVMLVLIAGVVWYLWLQNRHERVLKQKERKFNQLPTIERIYLLMLKDLRTGGKIKRATETEREFVLSVNPQYPGLLGKLIAEISGDYVAWRYGQKSPNEASLTHKFERFRELYSVELAEYRQKNNFISPGKNHSQKMLRPVK
jgi:hypothetical protein